MARHGRRDGRVEEPLVVCEEEVEIAQVLLELEVHVGVHPPHCYATRHDAHEANTAAV